MKLVRIPNRDANDADHLAIMLFVGGGYSLYRVIMSQDLVSFWLGFAILGLLTGPLLWLRLPHAKWGGVLAALLFGSLPFFHSVLSEFTLRNYFTMLASLVVVYWFVKIDYRHRFDADE